jgi:hypothetical protein
MNVLPDAPLVTPALGSLPFARSSVSTIWHLKLHSGYKETWNYYLISAKMVVTPVRARSRSKPALFKRPEEKSPARIETARSTTVHQTFKLSSSPPFGCRFLLSLVLPFLYVHTCS